MQEENVTILRDLDLIPVSNISVFWYIYVSNLGETKHKTLLLKNEVNDFCNRGRGVYSSNFPHTPKN